MKNTKNNTVFVVMGSGDNNGTLPEYTVRVFTSSNDADKYANLLEEAFFRNVVIVEKEVETKYTPMEL
jgi:hypothetical protein